MQIQVIDFLKSVYSILTLFLYKQLLQFSLLFVEAYNSFIAFLVFYGNVALTYIRNLKKEDKEDILFFLSVFYVLETLYFYVFVSYEK